MRRVGGVLGARAKALLQLQIGKLGRGGSGHWRTTSEAVSLGRARWSPEDVVKSKPAVEKHALTRAHMHAHAHAQRATINTHLWRHIPTNTRTHTHQPTPTNTHAYTHLQVCMSDDSSPNKNIDMWGSPALYFSTPTHLGALAGAQCRASWWTGGNAA